MHNSNWIENCKLKKTYTIGWLLVAVGRGKQTCSFALGESILTE